jgi:hypothetical protein
MDQQLRHHAGCLLYMHDWTVSTWSQIRGTIFVTENMISITSVMARPTDFLRLTLRDPLHSTLSTSPSTVLLFFFFWLSRTVQMTCVLTGFRWVCHHQFHRHQRCYRTRCERSLLFPFFMRLLTAISAGELVQFTITSGAPTGQWNMTVTSGNAIFTRSFYNYDCDGFDVWVRRTDPCTFFSHFVSVSTAFEFSHGSGATNYPCLRVWSSHTTAPPGKLHSGRCQRQLDHHAWPERCLGYIPPHTRIALRRSSRLPESCSQLLFQQQCDVYSVAVHPELDLRVAQRHSGHIHSDGGLPGR